MGSQTAGRALRWGVPFGVLFVFFVCLGRWQLQRMHEKEALFAEFESGGLITVPLSRVDLGTMQRYQHVIATGRYDTERQVLLDNMTHQGQVGYRVLTPLVGNEGDVVLVDRGWVKMGASRALLPDVTVSGELRGVAGRLDDPPRAGIALSSAEGDSWPRVMSYPDRAALERALGRKVFPRIVLLDADQPDGFVREWRPSTFPPQRHLGYAVTWFALALTTVICFFVSVFRRPTSRKVSSEH